MKAFEYEFEAYDFDVDGDLNIKEQIEDEYSKEIKDCKKIYAVAG